MKFSLQKAILHSTLCDYAALKAYPKESRWLFIMIEEELQPKGTEDDYNESEGEDELSSDDIENGAFVCEDCDYRWEGPYSEDEWDDKNVVCPMCGSTNATSL